MPFIKLANYLSDGDEVRSRGGVSLSSKDGTTIFGIADSETAELDFSGIKYDVIHEDALPRYLSEGGLNAYRGFKRSGSIDRILNPRVAPPGYTNMEITVDEPNIEAGFEIIKRRGGTDLNLGPEVATVLVTDEGIDQADLKLRRTLFCYFPLEREKIDALIRELSDKKISGHTPNYLLVYSRDPDKV